MLSSAGGSHINKYSLFSFVAVKLAGSLGTKN